MEIKVKENAVPYAVTGSAQIAFHHIKPGKQLVKELCEAKVFEKTNEPTKWLAPAFFTDKAGQPGKVRIVTDFGKLNNQVLRNTHPFSTGREI